MQPYELNIILESLEYSQKQQWEQTRYQCYVTAQTQSSKKLKPTDVIRFSWDKDNSTIKDTHVSKDDIERLKAKAESIAKNTQYNN